MKRRLSKNKSIGEKTKRKVNYIYKYVFQLNEYKKFLENQSTINVNKTVDIYKGTNSTNNNLPKIQIPQRIINRFEKKQKTNILSQYAIPKNFVIYNQELRKYIGICESQQPIANVKNGILFTEGELKYIKLSSFINEENGNNNSKVYYKQIVSNTIVQQKLRELKTLFEITPLHILKTNGKMYLMDGNHRLDAIQKYIKQKGIRDIYIPCFVHQNRIITTNGQVYTNSLSHSGESFNWGNN